MLTTEHFTLQTARSATVSEAGGRAASYLASVSGGLLALTLLAGGERPGPVFVPAAFAVGLMLALLGTTTFLRLVQSGIEDARSGVAIGRVRHAYLERAPHLRPYFLQSDHDDLPSVMANMGLRPGPRQILVTSASAVAVVNSSVLGALVAGGAAVLGVGAAGVVLGALAGFGVAFALHLRAERGLWDEARALFPSRFPAPGPAAQDPSVGQR